MNNTYSARLIALRLPRVCVAVAAAEPAELLDRAERVARDNSFIELRLDYLSKPLLLLPKLKLFLQAHLDLRVIATCRRAAAGGNFRGSVASQAEVLHKAIAAGCQLVDVELESAKAMRPAELEKLRKAAVLMISHHDPRGTRKLNETLAQMRAFPADLYKVVSTATSLADNVTMVRFLKENSDHENLVGVCMGEQGVISRVLGLRAGSLFTFAASAAGEETAPGQLTVQELRDTYRIEQVDAATRVYGVAGDPVAHSLSPLMIGTAFRRLNMNAVYLPLHAKTIDDLLACVRSIPIHGMSVTMPYKEEILKHLDNTDALTGRVKACNTVVRGADGKLYGFNTDVLGIVRPLENRLHLSGASILVIGAGGAARAAVFGLKERGADVHVISRTPQNAQKLAREAHAKFVQKQALKKMRFDAIVNASSAGMQGKSNESPLAEDEINAKYVMDIIYSPPETRLIRMARARGAQVITGADVFVEQGARQFEIWTGKPAPTEEMARVVAHKLAPLLPKEPLPAPRPAPKPMPEQVATPVAKPRTTAAARPAKAVAAKKSAPAPAKPAKRVPAKRAVPSAKTARPAAKRATAKPASKKKAR